MKLPLILALFTFGVPVIAHAQTAATPTVTASVAAIPMVPKSAETSDAFVWRFAPPVGSRWTMRSFARVSSESVIYRSEDGKAPQKLVTTYIDINKFTADYDIIARDALGATTIRLTLRNLTQDMSANYNGEKTQANVPITANAKSLDGATLTFKQAPDGKIWNIVGTRAFVRRNLEASGLFDAQTVNRTLDKASTDSREELPKFLNLTRGTLTNSPVRVGESWNSDMNLPTPFGFKVGGTRTVKELGDGVAAITDRANYGALQEQAKLPASPAGSRANIDYSQLNGVIYNVSQVQRSSGLPLEITSYQHIYGSTSTQTPVTKGSPAQNVTTPIDLTYSARVVLEPRE